MLIRPRKYYNKYPVIIRDINWGWTPKDAIGIQVCSCSSREAIQTNIGVARACGDCLKRIITDKKYGKRFSGIIPKH